MSFPSLFTIDWTRREQQTVHRDRHHEAVSDAIAGEGRAQLVGTLREVRPALEVQRYYRRRPEDDRRLRREVAREGEVGAVEPVRQLDRPGEQDRDVDGFESAGDLTDNVERGVVARDVDRLQARR